MQKTLDVIMFSLVLAILAYVFAFAIVGACLVGSNQPVSSCRDNVAGEIVYHSVSWIVGAQDDEREGRLVGENESRQL